MAGEEDPDDKTRVGSGPPTPPKLPARSPVKTPADHEPEHTQLASAPPPVPKPPANSATAAITSDQTQDLRGGPPVTKLQPRMTSDRKAASLPQGSQVRADQPAPIGPSGASHLEPAAPACNPLPVSATQPPSESEDEEGTIIIERSQVTARLAHVQPPGRSETIRLDRSSYVIGRSHNCDIRLYSPTAHREHARLTARDAQWYVSPLADNRVFLVNGTAMRRETRLTHKMRLQFGGDELLFLDESAAEQTGATTVSKRSPYRLAVVLLAIVAIAAAAAWLLLIQ